MSFGGTSGRKAASGSIFGDLETLIQKHDGPGFVNPRSFKWNLEKDRTMVQRNFDSRLGLPVLPGFGPDGEGGNARDDCGEAHPFVCDECGQSVEFGRTCGQSVCGRCAPAWCRDLAIKKAAKIRRYRKVKHANTQEKEHQKLHHQIISPPLSWYYDLSRAGLSYQEAQDVTKQAVKSILEEMRAQGVVIRHSFRGADDDGSIASENDDRGEWKERLFSRRDWDGDVRDELAWKPHFHCIVVADYLKGGDFTDKIEEETGWVIHRIADDDGISLETDGEMARALTYCLSHADIDVRDDSHNRSAVWEVGSFDGDPLKSSARFSPRPSDLEWAERVVREAASTVLGIDSPTTECGRTIPPVDDPDELARRVIAELYPDDDRRDDVDEDLVLHHIAEGNIGVDVATSAGGGGSVTVTDAFGEPIGAGGWGAKDIPEPPDEPLVEAADVPVTPAGDRDEHGDECDCSDDESCSGRLVPLGEARNDGFIHDEEWRREAPFADEAIEADEEWDDDLEPWRTSSPGNTIGID